MQNQNNNQGQQQDSNQNYGTRNQNGQGGFGYTPRVNNQDRSYQNRRNQQQNNRNPYLQQDQFQQKSSCHKGINCNYQLKCNFYHSDDDKRYFQENPNQQSNFQRDNQNQNRRNNYNNNNSNYYNGQNNRNNQNNRNFNQNQGRPQRQDDGITIWHYGKIDKNEKFQIKNQENNMNNQEGQPILNDENQTQEQYQYYKFEAYDSKVNSGVVKINKEFEEKINGEFYYKVQFQGKQEFQNQKSWEKYYHISTKPEDKAQELDDQYKQKIESFYQQKQLNKTMQKYGDSIFGYLQFVNDEYIFQDYLQCIEPTKAIISQNINIPLDYINLKQSLFSGNFQNGGQVFVIQQSHPLNDDTIQRIYQNYYLSTTKGMKNLMVDQRININEDDEITEQQLQENDNLHEGIVKFSPAYKDNPYLICVETENQPIKIYKLDNNSKQFNRLINKQKVYFEIRQDNSKFFNPQTREYEQKSAEYAVIKKCFWPKDELIDGFIFTNYNNRAGPLLQDVGFPKELFINEEEEEEDEEQKIEEQEEKRNESENQEEKKTNDQQPQEKTFNDKPVEVSNLNQEKIEDEEIANRQSDITFFKPYRQDYPAMILYFENYKVFNVLFKKLGTSFIKVRFGGWDKSRVLPYGIAYLKDNFIIDQNVLDINNPFANLDKQIILHNLGSQLKKIGDIEAETKIIQKLNGVELLEFGEEVMEELNFNKTEVYPHIINSISKDLSGEDFLTFSIDSPSTGAIDDCVTIKKLNDSKNDKYEFYIHFSASNLYIQLNKAIYNIGKSIGETNYGQGDSFMPLFPKEMYVEILSLLNGEVRAANTIYFVYDLEQKMILSDTFSQFECKIKNKYKLYYEHVENFVQQHLQQKDKLEKQDEQNEEKKQNDLEIGEDIAGNKLLQENLLILNEFAKFKKQKLQKLGCDPEQNQREYPISNNMVSQLMVQTNEYMQFYLEQQLREIMDFIKKYSQIYSNKIQEQKYDNQLNEESEEAVIQKYRKLINEIEITLDEQNKAKKTVANLKRKVDEYNQNSEHKIEINFNSLVDFGHTKLQMLNSTELSENVKGYFDFQLRINTINIQNYFILKENGLLEENEPEDDEEFDEFMNDELIKSKSKIIEQNNEDIIELSSLVKQLSSEIQKNSDNLSEQQNNELMKQNTQFLNQLIKRYYKLKRAYRLNFSNPIRKFQDHQVHHLFKQINEVKFLMQQFKEKEQQSQDEFQKIKIQGLQILQFRQEIIQNQTKFMDDQKRKAANREIEKSSKQRKLISNENQSDDMTAVIFECSKKDIRIFIQEVELQDKIEGGKQYFITKYEFSQEDLDKLIEIKNKRNNRNYNDGNIQQEDEEQKLFYYLFEEIPIKFNIKSIKEKNGEEQIIYPLQYNINFRFEDALKETDDKLDQKKQLLKKIQEDKQEQEKIKEQLDKDDEQRNAQLPQQAESKEQIDKQIPQLSNKNQRI